MHLSVSLIICQNKTRFSETADNLKSEAADIDLKSEAADVNLNSFHFLH